MTGGRKHAGLIRKYGLNMGRQAFREKAAEIGFVKVRGSFRRVCGVMLIGISTVEMEGDGARRIGGKGRGKLMGEDASRGYEKHMVVWSK